MTRPDAISSLKFRRKHSIFSGAGSMATTVLAPAFKDSVTKTPMFAPQSRTTSPGSNEVFARAINTPFLLSQVEWQYIPASRRDPIRPFGRFPLLVLFVFVDNFAGFEDLIFNLDLPLLIFFRMHCFF